MSSTFPAHGLVELVEDPGIIKYIKVYFRKSCVSMNVSLKYLVSTIKAFSRDLDVLSLYDKRKDWREREGEYIFLPEAFLRALLS